MIQDPCLNLNVGQRRAFWTTRPQACGEYNVCGAQCVVPGLEYEDRGDERTIKTDDWLNSLVLNILNTRARTDMKCPAPNAVFGHWSESYRDDGLYIGATLWNAAAKSYRNTTANANAIINAVRADLNKLTALQVVQNVEVDGRYVDAGRVEIVVLLTSSAGQNRINLAGVLVSEGWVWQ